MTIKSIWGQHGSIQSSIARRLMLRSLWHLLSCAVGTGVASEAALLGLLETCGVEEGSGAGSGSFISSSPVLGFDG